VKQIWGLVLQDLYGRKLKRPVMINGEALRNDKGEMQWEELSLAMVCAESLTNHQEGDEKHTHKDKARRTHLARQIIDAPDDSDIPMDAKTLAELIERVNKGGWHAVIIADVTGMLEIDNKH
jgi:hypothetical protein